MPFQVTAIYTAIITVLVIVLSTAVTMKRAQTGISILHGDNMDLALRIRRHGNLVENAALALLLIALCEARGLGVTWLHVMGIALVLGRIAHMIGLSATNASAPLRIVGGTLTHATMLGASVYLIWSQF